MAAFTNLSDDLIYHLALPFQHDRSTLHALNLVSRALHRATLALLFRHTSQLTPAQNHLLHRTLSENPELKRYVHSCSVAIDHGKLDDAQLAWILALSNVRDLTVRRYDALQRTGNYWTDIRNASQLYRFGRSVECDFECGFLDKYEWKGVRSVCLQGGFTGTEIVRFVQLPDIRSLEATVLHIVNAPRVPDSPRPSTLTTLELRGGSLWRMEPSALRSILAFAPGLRVLRCQVPMDTMSNSIEEQTCSVVRPVSSAELCAALEPVRASLEELCLLNLRHCVPYDGTFLDLSGFSSLTHLEITSCCLLPVGAPRDRRGDLGKMLPASLARLKLDFPRESGIFYHHGEGAAFLSQNPEVIPQARYHWIVELLRHKASSLPRLASVEMVDPPGTIGYWRWQTLKWSPPDEVAALCENSGVVLDVAFSCPVPGSNLDSWKERRCKSRGHLDEWSYSQ